MALHQTSGRAGRGLALAATTAGLWATLPLALKLTLEQLDPMTVTWFRFLVAFVCLGAYLGARGRLGRFRTLGRREWGLLAIAAAMLIGNYVAYLMGLHRTTPANSQLLIQLAPLLMAIGGIVVFREPFAPAQWGGALVLLAGLGLFFFDQLRSALVDADRYVIGSGLIVLAAATWAAYALAQKQLLGTVSSLHVLVFIFAVASVVLLPFATPSRLLALDGLHWATLAFCSLNTLLAYAAFAEALAHLEASRVSVVLAINPLLTVAVVTGAHALFPARIEDTHVAALGIAGAFVAVGGSMATSLLGRRRVRRIESASSRAPELVEPAGGTENAGRDGDRGVDPRAGMRTAR